MDLIELVGRRHPTTRVLVLSTHEELGVVEKAFRAGARGYVMKSESTDQIVPAIQQVHAGRLYAAAHVLADLAVRLLGRGADDEPDVARVLSARELDVFRRLGDGQSTRRIADDLDVSLKTVQTYCARIKEKLGLDDAGSLLRSAAIWRDRETR
jgi:DNA-binding NarL/FixJ family response regulator